MTESVKFPYGYNLEEFTAPTTSATYIYSEVKKSWIFSAAQASGGRITISQFAPAGPLKNDIWIKEEDYSMYVWNSMEIPGGGGLQSGNWIGLTNMGITASVAVSPEPPIYTQNGAMWYNNVTGDLKVRYYNDNGEDPVWVAVTNNGLLDLNDSNNFDVEGIIKNIEHRIHALEEAGYISL